MKVYVLALVVAIAAAARIVRQEPEIPPIVDLRSESINYGNGTFKAAVERSDGSKIYQAGYIRNPEEPDEELRVQVLVGQYSQVEPDGQELTLVFQIISVFWKVRFE